jgi:hypothetical protein
MWKLQVVVGFADKCSMNLSARKTALRLFGFLFLALIASMSLFPVLARAEGMISKIFFFYRTEPSEADRERTTKDMMRQAIDQAVLELSQVNGFYHQPDLRINIPEQVKGIEKISKKFNTNLFWHDFELGLNRAAEVAAPKAGVLMRNALQDLKFEKDPEQILSEEGSLTSYFRRKTEDRLYQDFRQEIEKSIGSQAALNPYVEMKTLYASIPFVKNSEDVFVLEEQISRKALEALFSKVSEQEDRMRSLRR